MKQLCCNASQNDAEIKSFIQATAKIGDAIQNCSIWNKLFRNESKKTHIFTSNLVVICSNFKQNKIHVRHKKEKNEIFYGFLNRGQRYREAKE